MFVAYQEEWLLNVAGYALVRTKDAQGHLRKWSTAQAARCADPWGQMARKRRDGEPEYRAEG